MDARMGMRVAPVLVVAVLVVMALVAGCGSSLTAVTPRTSRPTAARAVTPFCEALDEARTAAQPVSRVGIGQRVDDVSGVARRVRAANQQVGALAPPELRGDVDRLSGVLDRQLTLLEQSGGDTLAAVRDPDLLRQTTDPEYAAASRRVDAYVRQTC